MSTDPFKVSDIDQRMTLRVEQGKGQRDRLSCSPRGCSNSCAKGGGRLVTFNWKD
jgi:hypothetical protein